ncbi:MAG: VWA domain-containing protein [Bacteroidota bacterium]
MKHSILGFLFLVGLSVVLGALVTGCSNSLESSSEEIDLYLLDAQTEMPSKVRLFLQVDVSELDHLSVLDEPEFEIYENGARISELESRAQVRRERGEFLYSSLLLLDLSGSILNNQDLPPLKTAAASFAERALPPVGDGLHGTREMAVYWFDGAGDIHQLVSFTDDRESVLEAIESIDESISDDMSTNLNGAVVAGLARIESRLQQVATDSATAMAGSVVIFTDGTDQAARVSESEALEAVRTADRDKAIFTIGLGGEIDENVLSQFGKNGFEMASDSLELEESFLAIADRLEREAGSYYVLEYCSPKRAGGHSLRLVAMYEELHGSLSTNFSAEGFTGGCSID